MATQSRAEDHHVPDEERPLLEDQVTPCASDFEPLEVPRSKSPISKYVWTATWVVLALLIIAIFVKGWLDADGDVEFDFGKALKKALGGGLSGALAMVLQVLLLMPLRTVMNYQYRHGTDFTQATHTLYNAGGIRRYYQGIGAALIQGPVARFGDTAANAGILALLQSNPYLKTLPSLAKTVFASLCAAAFRMVLTPIDTIKTTFQAQGADAKHILRQRIRDYGIGTLWWGAFATAGATFVGHYPWFATYNFLSQVLKEPPKDELLLWLARLALIGFIASVISDTVSNSLRVVKTFRQVNDEKISYSKAAQLIVSEEGILGLFSRGLKTRILANGLQGLLFSVLWKLFMDLWEKYT